MADFLRNKSGMKIKTGIHQGKRVDYFKGPSRPSPVVSLAKDGELSE